MKILNRIIYGIFFCFALAFIATINYRPYPLVFIIKSIPVFSLAFLVFYTIPGSKGKAIGIALIASGIGDIILEVDRETYFVYGLIAFLIAHIFYIIAFIRKPEIDKSRTIVSLAIIAYGIIMAYLLVPYLENMFIPVMVYLCVIVAMGVSSSIGTTNHYLVLIGACFFLVSDSILAINRFRSPIPFSTLWIMMTYYAAQFFITFGSKKTL